MVNICSLLGTMPASALFVVFVRPLLTLSIPRRTVGALCKNDMITYERDAIRIPTIQRSSEKSNLRMRVTGRVFLCRRCTMTVVRSRCLRGRRQHLESIAQEIGHAQRCRVFAGCIFREVDGRGDSGYLSVESKKAKYSRECSCTVSRNLRRSDEARRKSDRWRT